MFYRINMIIVYFILLLPLSFAKKIVAVYQDDLHYRSGSKLSLKNPVFTFDHHADDKLNMILILDNIQPNVKFDVFMSTQLNTNSPKELHQLKYDAVNESRVNVYIEKSLMTFANVNICVHLLKTGGPVNKTIAIGRLVRTVPNVLTKGVCLRAYPCFVVVDLANVTSDEEPVRFATPTKPVTAATVVEKNRTDINVLVGTTSSRAPVESTTPVARDVANPGTTNNSSTIIISVVSAAVLIPLVVIVVCKCCWGKGHAKGTPQSQTNDLSNRFYVNMIFRRECNYEIQEREQHQYEEIELQYYEEIGQPQYEEIKPL